MLRIPLCLEESSLLEREFHAKMGLARELSTQSMLEIHIHEFSVPIPSEPEARRSVRGDALLNFKLAAKSHAHTFAKALHEFGSSYCLPQSRSSKTIPIRGIILVPPEMAPEPNSSRPLVLGPPATPDHLWPLIRDMSLRPAPQLVSQPPPGRGASRRTEEEV